ncbi:pyridine nucleotide-disulfide oxidoreductase domain protein [Salix suchowensis]|nr:pyridine nucleotide-disulfide oxidoreductase domain protein [Salix suchowensis]
MKHLSRVEERVERGDDVDELKQENTELQIQLAKARSSHGQVRVEKELLSEKLKQQEVECQRLQAKLAEVEENAAAASAEVSPVQARNKELEEALGQALSRLQASDVASQTYQEQITRLEENNKELESEKQSLKTKSESLDVQLTLSKRDKDAVEHSLLVIQQQNDYLTSQQDHWDALKATSAQLDVLTKLVSQGDQEELKELRQVRERSKVLESEHTSLLKRFRDQENKATNTEKANNQLRQSLAQNQQRALEWERRAKEYEGQLELTRTQLEQSEQTHSQLEADYSLAKLQLDEREADDRLAKDRENKLNEQIASLESKAARLQGELDKAKRLAIPPSTPLRKLTNGSHVPPRPDSRSSTVYGENRAITPNLRTNSQARSIDNDTPPNQKSVWDSMHAPATYNGYNTGIYSPVPSRYPAIGNGTPRSRPNQTSRLSRASVASPTPSIVSQAPPWAKTDGIVNYKASALHTLLLSVRAAPATVFMSLALVLAISILNLRNVLRIRGKTAGR